PVTKAYRNQDFLNSAHARHLRILAEYEETMQRLRASGVRATIQVFGSARAKDRGQYDRSMAELVEQLEAAKPGSEEHAEVEERITKLKSIEWMCDYMASIEELARRLTEWSMGKRQSRQMSPVPHRRFAYLPHSSEDNHPESRAPKAANLFIATGGGPGFMEAANRGASRVPGGRSAGMGISLPFETGLNPYVTPELAFEYHYFFTRKFAMAYYMQALVAAPGGFGTMDEFFELITLKQTGKMNQAMPVVLFGKKYWNTVVNWHAIADFGTINRKEVDEILFTDSVDEAFDYI
ncbi:putative lysine decarboxylase, partial [Emiliania huxleyi CCMP1516]|uniref:Lysine decarboxylase n=4 Tax=Emiliania huxleyi TaxID=2903 RepID=A0A0D3K9Z2_EMIH1